MIKTFNNGKKQTDKRRDAFKKCLLLKEYGYNNNNNEIYILNVYGDRTHSFTVGTHYHFTLGHLQYLFIHYAQYILLEDKKLCTNRLTRQLMANTCD